MGDIVIYEDGEIHLKLSLEKDTFWLDANDIANIFGVNRPAVVKHIGNIYKSEELDKKVTCSILEQVAKDGKKRKKNYYNFDMIISVGYRVNSKKATKFRIKQTENQRSMTMHWHLWLYWWLLLHRNKKRSSSNLL